MKAGKIELWVGLFMLVGIVCAVVLSLKVAGLVLNESSQTYTVKAKFSNVGSLKLRAPVKIGGVLIGRVERISIDAATMTPVVEMAIRQEFNKLSSESRASILTAGLIGEQYIGLTPGFYDEEMGSTYLKDGDTIEDTASALAIEELIGKFLYNNSQEAGK